MNQKMTIWIYMIKVVVWLQQQRLLQVIKRFLFLKQPQSVPSSKVEDIEEESHKRKESISGYRIIHVNILGLVMVEILCAMCGL